MLANNVGTPDKMSFGYNPIAPAAYNFAGLGNTQVACERAMSHDKERHLQERIIPIMPCPDIRVQAAFYQSLGFEVLGRYTSPNPYAALQWRNVELHFWGNRKVLPSGNSTMCFLMVTDVDEVNRIFTEALKKQYGKIPRTGLPRITKVRNLVGDRRFTLTDPGGNTLFVGQPSTEEDRFFRQLGHKEHAKIFAALYDVLYSKEDPELAATMLPKYQSIAASLQGLDQAKFLLLQADIQLQNGGPAEDNVLLSLLKENKGKPGWEKIRKKYQELLQLPE